MSLFEVRNVAGRLQFSVDQPPICLLQKIIVPTNDATPRRIGGGTGSQQISHYGKLVDIPPATQLLASYCEMIHRVDYRTGNHAAISVEYNGNTPLELYCFGLGVPTSDSGGFEMRNASNQVIFNANTRVFKPITFVTYAQPVDSDYGTLVESYTGPSGRKLAFVGQNEGAYTRQDKTYEPNINPDAPQYQQQASMFGCAITSNGNIVNFDAFLMNRLKKVPADDDLPEPPYVHSKGSGLVIDVTGY